ncbi:MAG: S-layer homology domain-containing protein [Candidatus Margulisiibacteriota bacterium]
MMKKNKVPILLLFLWLFILSNACAIAREKTELAVYQPYDKTIVYSNSITVEGFARGDNRIEKVLVNSKEVFISSDGKFVSGVPLTIGKNTLDIVALDKKNKILAEKKKRVLRLKTFKDLGDDPWSRDAVEGLATLGIISGYPDGNFLPNNSITRAEIIAWIVALLTSEAAVPESDKFYDLTPSHWAYRYIILADEKGFIKGYPDGGFRPNNTVTRMEALAIVARFMDLPAYAEVNKSPFMDVSPDYWGFPIIISASKAGLLTYVKTAYLGPADQISRGEVAVLLSKTKLVLEKMGDLYDFLHTEKVN